MQEAFLRRGFQQGSQVQAVGLEGFRHQASDVYKALGLEIGQVTGQGEIGQVTREGVKREASNVSIITFG